MFLPADSIFWTLSNSYGFGWRLRLLPPVEAFGVSDAVGANGPSFTSAAIVGFAAQLLNAISLSHFRSPPALARTEIDPNPLGSQPITRMVWVRSPSITPLASMLSPPPSHPQGQPHSTSRLLVCTLCIIHVTSMCAHTNHLAHILTRPYAYNVVIACDMSVFLSLMALTLVRSSASS